MEITQEYGKISKRIFWKNVSSIKCNENEIKLLEEYFEINRDDLIKLLVEAYDDTPNETYQTMEGILHNLNTMLPRGGNQVVFSSINYGTDTSEEGRMAIRELLKATSKRTR